MKQTVLIFTGKHHFKFVDTTRPNGSYDDEALKEAVNKAFPPDEYDVEIIDYPKCTCFYNFEEIWKRVRLPILIGYREGANYIEPVKNYSRKYLISPLVFPGSMNEDREIDEYDKANTICLFGGDGMSIANAHMYKLRYPCTHYGLAAGLLDLCGGVECLSGLDGMILC